MSANKFFHSIDRAPCEFGILLRALPPHFPVSYVMSADERLQAEAAIKHASNGSFALMNGLVAIGHLLFSAANNSEFPPSTDVLEDLGGLIRHLAVESLFLQEQRDGFKSALDTDTQRAAEAGQVQKRGAK